MNECKETRIVKYVKNEIIIVEDKIIEEKKKNEIRIDEERYYVDMNKMER